DPGTAGHTNGGPNLQPGAVDIQVEGHLDTGDGQRVTQRNQVRSALGRHDSGHLSNREHITLGNATAGNQPGGLRAHADHCPRRGLATGDVLLGYIDHPRPTAFVEMCELRSRHRGWSTSWNSLARIAGSKPSKPMKPSNSSAEWRRPGR